MKIVLGFSGGVDSSVSAVLLKRAGHEVHGLYLDIAGEAARESAISTAEQISIPLEVRNISEELEQHVCRPFVNAYLSGDTFHSESVVRAGSQENINVLAGIGLR